MFEDIEKETFVEKEEKIQKFWNEFKIFEYSLENRKNSPRFTYYDGPPFATGLPHYGHLLAGTIKDVVCRYKTMKGFFVERTFGWDCHGLPVEQEVEKQYKLSGAASIEEFGIERFNEACRDIVLRYTATWKSTVERMGRWVDFSRSWKTMDLTFMESVWWVFKQMYEKGLIYEGFKVMPFSAKLGTPLSNFEASENYQETDDPSVFVAIPLKDDPNLSLLIWTTTPWTLVSNLAVIVKADLEYAVVQIQKTNQKLILSHESLHRLFPQSDQYAKIRTIKGEELIGKRYMPLFPYFVKEAEKGAFRVIADDFVEVEEGTGIVHAAPAFGETDFYACKKAGIGIVCPVDQNGKFTSEIPEYEGMFVKDTDKSIIQRLKEMSTLVHRTTFRHRYPFCWRSDTPLIYRAMKTWFVSVETFKDKLLKANRQIHWTPSFLKEGRFGNWLEGARDWAISRNRYWGTPIPIWKSEEGDIVVIGSIEELESLSGTKISDLHRHFIDSLTFIKNGKLYRRISEVFDCWFDAGSMPYGQNHYPFENKSIFEKKFPADFIAEGMDQTRGWFYTLTVIAAALFDQPAFKNVIVNGIVLTEDGSKMSKRLKNYPEPDLVIHKYGADAIRLYLLHSPAVKGDDLRFSEKGVELILRQILIPFWHAYTFFVTYAKIYHWEPQAFSTSPEAVIDQWILSLTHKLIKNVQEGMDRYDLNQSVEPFVEFVDQLTNWYIRRSRRRFWSDEENLDRKQAFETLYAILINLCKVSASFIPFLSESIYLNLRSQEMPQSVHLCDYPTYDASKRNQDLEMGMSALQVAVSIGHSLRKEHKLKVRQPLPAVYIVCTDPKILTFLEHQKHLILEELNVKNIELHSEKREFVKHTIKPNFRILGKKVGSYMKEAQFLISQFEEDTIIKLMQGHSHSILLAGKSFALSLEDVEISHTAQEGWIAMNVGNITLALDTTLSEELILEGIAREIVNKINTMRRQANFAVTDRINVKIVTTDLIKKALNVHGDYVKQEVLALDIQYGDSFNSMQWDINGEPTAIAIEKVN